MVNIAAGLNFSTVSSFESLRGVVTVKRFGSFEILKLVSLCFALCYVSPTLALAPASSRNALSTRTSSENLMPAQEELLKTVQKDVLSFLEFTQTDSAQLASCFASSICPMRPADQMEQFRNVILMEVKRYRLLVGRYRIDSLKRGQRRVAPFLTTVPPVLLSNEEAAQVFRIAVDDHTAIAKTLGTSPSSPASPVSRSSGLGKDAIEFYRLQLEQLLNRFPFIAHLESEEPSSMEISRALQKVYVASKERSRNVADLKGADLKKLLLYRPIVDAVVSKRPEFRTAYEELSAQPTPGIFGWPKESESVVYQAYLGCVGLFLLAPGWPMGLTCTTIALVSSTGKLIDNFDKYVVSRADWLVGLQTFQSMRRDRNQLVLSAVTLAVMGYTWYPVVGMIKGPLSAALEQTVVQTVQRMASLSALRGTAVGFGQSFVKTKLRIGGGYLLLKDHSERSDQNVLVPVEFESGLDALLIETGPFFRFADLQRLSKQVFPIWQ